MKIKRFLAPNMREALKAVREEQGPDAVILSNRRVGDYIEIVAALDYDESLVNQTLKWRNADGGRAGPDRDDHAADDDDDDDDDDGIGVELSAAAVRSADRDAGNEFGALLGDAHHSPERVTSHRRADTHVTELDIAPAKADDTAEVAAMRDELANLRGLLQDQVSALLWQRSAESDPTRAEVLRSLARLGVAADVAGPVASRVCRDGEVEDPLRASVEAFAQSLPLAAEDLLERGGIAAFVGPTGVGKTTTIAKIASRFAMRHGSRDVALVSTDSYRIGAQAQLRTFGRILNARVFSAASAVELRSVLEQVAGYRLVLIDTAGVGQRDMRLVEILDGLSNQRTAIDLYLTLAATVQDDVLNEIVEQFSQVRLAGCALTKIDEATRIGGPLSTLIRHELPLAWLGDGQRVPDDLHNAAKRLRWLAARALEGARPERFIPDEHVMARRLVATGASHV